MANHHKYSGILIAALLFFVDGHVNAASWRIGNNDNYQAHFTDINEAMDSNEVQDGDTLYLNPGCMLDGNQTVSKRVTVIGTGFLSGRPETACVTGILYINADYAKFECVNIGMIFIGADHVTIERCQTDHILWSKQGHHLTLRQSKVGRVLGTDSSLTPHKAWTYYATIENCIILFNWYYSPVEELERATIHHNYIYNEWSGSKSFESKICLMYDVCNSKIYDNILLRSARPNQIFVNCSGNTVNNNVISSTASAYTDSQNNIYLGSADPSIVFSLTGEGDEQYRLCDNSPAHGSASDGGDCGPYGGNHPYIPGGLVDTNNELPKLKMSASATELEEGDTFTLTVKADRVPEETTTLMLTCDHSVRFDFPSKLVLPAGESTVSTAVTVIDDHDIADTQSAAFTVSAENYESGEALVMVYDDDMPHIELELAPTAVSANTSSNAIMGTIKRSDNLISKVIVVLSDDTDGVLTYSPQQVTLERNATEAHFTISPKGTISTDREVNVTAAVYVKTCDCPAGAQSGGSTTQKLALLAGEGAALNMEPLATDFSLDSNENSVVITIESPLQDILSVNVTSNFDDYLDYSHAVEIPAGETSVSIPVKRKGEGGIFVGQVITFTATATGYATAACWMIATESSLPDAVITSFEANATEAEAGSEVELTVVVKNTGSSQLSEETPVKIILSDGSYPVMLKTGTVLSSGESTTLTTSYQLPLLTGEYSFQAIVNPSGKIKEAVTSNNMSQEIPITINPNFHATAVIDKATYGQGEIITVTGKATGTQSAFVDVEVYFINDDMRQTVTAKTDAEGNYSAVFLPLDGTSGHFVIGVCFPGEGKTDAMAEADVFGLTTSSHRTTCQFSQGGSYNGVITISNPGSLPQTGVRVEQQDVPEGCVFSFPVIDKIEAGETLDVSYAINSVGNDATGGQKRMNVLIKSNEGALTEHAIDYSIEPAKGCLKTDSTSIVMTMTLGVAREFPVTIWNEGMSPTGAISLKLPNWIVSVTPQQLPSLASGDSVTVILRIVPKDNMYLNIPKTGRIGVNCTDGTGLSLSLEVTPVSEQNGTFTIDVIDEFTYCTEEKPHVSGAKVQVVNRATQAVVAEGVTNAEGKFTANIPEGWYRLKIEADYHESYDEYLLVDPGTNKTKRVFISFNGITTEWKVEETEIEDEYSMETVVKFETQVPPPYIDVIWPEERPQLGKYFPVTLVNKGLIKFFDVKTNLRVSSSKYSVEIVGNSEVDTLAAGQAAVLYARLISKKNSNPAGTARRTSEAVTPISGNDVCLIFNSDINACYQCYVKQEKDYGQSKIYGNCKPNKPYTSGSSTGGGGSTTITDDDENESNDPSEPEHIACDLPKFKIITVNGNERVLGVATDGTSQVRIVLDGDYDEEHNNRISWGNWTIDGNTNHGAIEYIDKNDNPNPLKGVIYTAPSYFPGDDEAVYKVRLTLPYILPDKEDPDIITIEVELIRIPVLMVHGLASSDRCWKNDYRLGLYEFLMDQPEYDGNGEPEYFYNKIRYQAFQLHALSYESTNKNHFSDNISVIGQGLKNLIGSVNKAKYVAEKIDVVAHSMGGLLTKLYIQENKDSVKDKFNKIITINTPHGGSQLGNFMTDPKINFIHEVEISGLSKGPYWWARVVINKLFEKFCPRNKDGSIGNMSEGAVADLSVGKVPIDNIDNGCTSGIECHAIVTSATSDSDLFGNDIQVLKHVYNETYEMLGYTNVDEYITDIFDGENDMVVPYLSQMGGCGSISFLPINHPGNNPFTHTETCHNRTIQNEVLRLLKLKKESNLDKGYGDMSGLLKYEMKKMTWEHILKEFPYNKVKNNDFLFNKYVGFDNNKDLYFKWKNNDWTNNSSAMIKAKNGQKETSTLTLAYEYVKGDTIIKLKVIPSGEFSKISFGCLYQDSPFAYNESTEGDVRLPNKIRGRVVVICEGRDVNGEWFAKADTVEVNTIGNSTIQKLSFAQDSFLVANDEYFRPLVLCTWSDGMVTEVENPTLSVTNGNLAYIEDNKYVYGKNSGHTNLVATYGNLSCSTPLEVYITNDTDEEESGGNSNSANSVCSDVSLSFKNKSVMTRQAFRGTLTINNNHPSLPLQKLRLHLEVRDEDGKMATQREFQINPESLTGDFTGELDFDTGWDLKSGGTGVATVLFIPTKNAAPSEPKRWSFGGTISYTDPFTGLVVTHSLNPVTLTVNPTPILDFTYFLQRDAIGDDPMTEDVKEKKVPFEFALLINNKGNADANNLKFVCKRPEIEENDQGLQASFTMLNAQLNGEYKALPLSDDIPIEVGTVPAQSQSYVQWWMRSSLLGHFTEYDVSFNHKTSCGNEDLSLIDQVSIHELIRGFTPHSTGESCPKRAFLVNDTEDSRDMPDRIYYTDATQQEVTMASAATLNRQTGTEYVQYMLTVTPTIQGWTYAILDNPIDGNAQILRITRQSDGVDIPADNIWLTYRTLLDNELALRERKLHFIGDVPEGGEQYLIEFELKPDLQLMVETYDGVPAEDVELNGTLTELTVHFNKPINEATFTVDDLTLYHEGVKVDISATTITQIDEQTFKLNLGTATSQEGYYALMVNTQDIIDIDGYDGVLSKEASWIQKEYEEPSVSIEVTDISQLTDAIYVTPFFASVGSNVEMAVCLKNAQPATAYMFDLVLPKGITLATNGDGKYIDALSDRHDNHSRLNNYRGDNTYTLSSFSFSSEELTGNDGAIRLLTLRVDRDMSEGMYAINIKKASYSKPNGALVKMPDTTSSITVESYIVGDVNADGKIDIGDAVSIIDYLMGGGTVTFVEKAADTNKDGVVDMRDAETIVNFLLGKIASLSR